MSEESENPMEDKDDTQPRMKIPPEVQAAMRPQSAPSSRRAFLQRLLIGGGAALGAGGVVAYVMNQRQTVVVVTPNGDSLRMPAATADEATDLLAELARLRNALSDSDTEKRDLSQRLADAQDEVNALRAERDEAFSLLDIYEALEDINLDDIIAAGLGAVAPWLAATLEGASKLEAAVERGLDLLKAFVEQIPGPREALIWLRGEIEVLLINLEALETRIKEVIEPVATFAGLVTEFILDVLKKLPFGLGNPARGGLETMQAIVVGLPELTARILNEVLNPLGVWFGQDNRTNLTGTLVTPLEDEVIGQASESAAAVTSLGERYQSELLGPVQAALDERAALRQQLSAAYARLDVLRGNVA